MLRHPFRPPLVLSIIGIVTSVWTGCSTAGVSIRVEGAWARPTSASTPAAVYLSILNEGNRPDRLIGARSARCATAEIHRSRVRDGRMSMVPVEDGIVVEPRAEFVLEPGAYHLMLFDLSEPLREGERFAMSLVFEQSGEIPVKVEVRRHRR